MVRTLLKHEAKAYLHTLIPMNIILICIAVFTRAIWPFEGKNTVFDIVGVSSIVALCVAMIVSIIMAMAFSIIRFYKNMFTAEGYLTMTLPVSPAQHIFAKLICAVGFNLLTFVGVAVAACIAMAGDMALEVFRAVFWLAGRYMNEFELDGAMWIAEMVVLMLIMLITQFLLYYTCISIGQLAKKNRVLAAFGVYFIYYFICQIIGTVFIVVFSLLANTPLMETVFDFISKHQRTTVHIALIGISVIYAILGAVYYFITHRIISRRLNLE